MKKNNSIPVLKRESYKKSYLREEEKTDRSSIFSSPVRHFDIHRRCIWRNHIPAHRLDFYLVFIVTQGEGIHRFGLQEHEVRENMLCFVGPDIISSWTSMAESHHGYFCAFSEEFFNLFKENKDFLIELPFFRADGPSVLPLCDASARYYLSLFDMMYKEYQDRNEFSDDILRSQLQLLIHKAYAQYMQSEHLMTETSHPGMRLLRAFTKAYMRDFKTLSKGGAVSLKKVSEYAAELGVSQNHLNDTVKAITGTSAGQLIKRQMIKYATTCLKHSTKSISEIAYAFGFEDPSYFARYYKSQTGISPSEYR